MAATFRKPIPKLWRPSIPIHAQTAGGGLQSSQRRCCGKQLATPMLAASGRGEEHRTSSTACSRSQRSNTIAKPSPKMRQLSIGCSSLVAATHCSPSSGGWGTRARAKTGNCGGVARTYRCSSKQHSRSRSCGPRQRKASRFSAIADVVQETSSESINLAPITSPLPRIVRCREPAALRSAPRRPLARTLPHSRSRA